MSSSDGRGLARSLVLILGIVAILGLGVVLLSMRAIGAQAPPEELTNQELLTRVAGAVEDPPEFSASVSIEQGVIPAQLLEASGQGEGPPALSGPLNARVWYGGPERVRAELQGENGDRVFVQNGPRVWLYDGVENTLRTGEGPPRSTPVERDPVTPAEVNRMLAELAPTSELSQGPPVGFEGRQAYVLTLTPKDGDSTLVQRARALIDSETYLPLEYAVYADGRPDPVFSWRVSNFEPGPVPAGLFDFQAPPGAEVLPFEHEENARDMKPADRGEPKEVQTVAEAQERVDFRVRELATAPGGRELTGVYLKGTDGVVLTYGSGWGTVVLAQGPQGEGSGMPPRPGNGEQTNNLQQLPTVDLGGGTEAQELSTPVGSGLHWSEGGVSYVLAGSVPAPELEQAARGLR